VNISDKSNIIYADTLTHFRKTKFSIADGDVSISNLKDNLTVFGNHLEDDGKLKYTLVNENPVLMQVDTSVSRDDSLRVTITIDTLVIKSKIMESFRSGTNMFKAIDSVKILRQNFASVNDLTTYFRDEEKIVTNKSNDTTQRPILWYENSQLTGDSITIYLKDGEIQNLTVSSNSFMLSQNKIFTQRFDQTSADSVQLYFTDNKLQHAEFAGKVQSIYFLFDDDKPNGSVKSTAHRAVLMFKDNEIDQVRLYGSPTSEYYPEIKVDGLERTFTLPKFVLKENRPVKKDFFNQTKKNE
jgi:hypothetical protein